MSNRYSSDYGYNDEDFAQRERFEADNYSSNYVDQAQRYQSPTKQSVGDKLETTSELKEWEPDNKEVQALVRNLSEDREQAVESVRDNTFVANKYTGEVKHPTLTKDQIDTLVDSLDDNKWKYGVANSTYSEEEFNLINNRLSRSVKDILSQQDFEKSSLELKNDHYLEAYQKQSDVHRNQVRKNEELEEELVSTDEQLQNVTKQRNIAYVLAAVLGILAIILSIWVYSLKSNDIDVDPNNMSDNPEVAQMQQQVLQTNKEKEDLQSQLDQSNKDLEEANKNLEKANSNDNNSNSSQDKELRDANNQVQKLESENFNLKSQIDSKNQDITSKQNRINDLENSLDQARNNNNSGSNNSGNGNSNNTNSNDGGFKLPSLGNNNNNDGQ